MKRIPFRLLPSMGADEVTALLGAVGRGEPGSTGRLIDAVHAELRRMAQGKMRVEGVGHTLQPTALVHEAYLRLRLAEGSLGDRAHFFGAAARAMERVLVDHARQKRAAKRGGDAERVTLDHLDPATPGADLDALELHEVLEALEGESEELAALVRYRWFVGLTLEQIAELEEVSLATVKRRWTFARAWLYDRLGG